MIIPFRMNIAHILTYFKKNYYERKNYVSPKWDSILIINGIPY